MTALSSTVETTNDLPISLASYYSNDGYYIRKQSSNSRKIELSLTICWSYFKKLVNTQCQHNHLDCQHHPDRWIVGQLPQENIIRFTPVYRNRKSQPYQNCGMEVWQE